MIKVGVIGYGYWGPNLARNFAEASGTVLAAVCDRDPGRLGKAKARYPSVLAFTEVDELMASREVDAIAIATPVWTHFDLAMKALQAGKHVFVEKPFTSTSDQARRLIGEADRRKLVLMVDHTFIYTGAVRKIKELVQSNAVGKLRYYDSVRVNLGLFQHDVNVLWDLAVHDLAIMDYLIGHEPQAVSATGMAHIQGQPENVAYLTCVFADNFIAHFHVNWLAPVKIRRTLICGDQKMIVYDDLEPSEKIKVYDKGVMVNPSRENVYQLMVGYRSGDMWAPQLEMIEALRAEVQHFADCIEKGGRPLTDGQAGLRVVQILEKACESLKARSELLEIKP